MPINIKIGLARVNARPPLVALADVVVKADELEITIRRCAVFEKAGQPPWATLPRIPIDKNGKRVYFNLLDLPTELKREILEKILQEFAAKRDA